jgi:hypothetical protein
VPDGRVPDGCGFRRQSEDPLPAPLPHPQPHPQRHSARQPAASRDHEDFTVCADCQGFMIMKIDSQFGRARSGSDRIGPPAIPGPCPASHHKAALYPRRTTTPPHPPAPNRELILRHALLRRLSQPPQSRVQTSWTQMEYSGLEGPVVRVQCDRRAQGQGLK